MSLEFFWLNYGKLKLSYEKQLDKEINFDPNR